MPLVTYYLAYCVRSTTNPLPLLPITTATTAGIDAHHELRHDVRGREVDAHAHHAAVAQLTRVRVGQLDLGHPGLRLLGRAHRLVPPLAHRAPLPAAGREGVVEPAEQRLALGAEAAGQHGVQARLVLAPGDQGLRLDRQRPREDAVVELVGN